MTLFRGGLVKSGWLGLWGYGPGPGVQEAGVGGMGAVRDGGGRGDEGPSGIWGYASKKMPFSVILAIGQNTWSREAVWEPL